MKIENFYSRRHYYKLLSFHEEVGMFFQTMKNDNISCENSITATLFIVLENPPLTTPVPNSRTNQQSLSNIAQSHVSMLAWLHFFEDARFLGGIENHHKLYNI